MTDIVVFSEDDRPRPTCATCLDVGVLALRDGWTRYCRCALGPDIWKQVGIPMRHHAAPIVYGPPESVYLWGEPGRGKTWEAVGRLKASLALRTGGRFVAMPELESARRRAVAEDGEMPGEREVSAPFLVADDFLRGPRVTPFWQEYLLTFVMQRHAANRITVFTSNFPLEHVAKTLEPYVADRIHEMCAEVREVTGRNWRLGR